MTTVTAPHYITRADAIAYRREILDQCSLVKLETAAVILDCSPKKLQRLVEAGHLAAYNEGRHAGIRFKASDLREYVQGLKIPTEAWNS